jgi:hypothetical protein
MLLEKSTCTFLKSNTHHGAVFVELCTQSLVRYKVSVVTDELL